MDRRIVRILRTAVVIMMALVFVGCSEKGCAPDQPHLAIANDTDTAVMTRVTGADMDRAANMLPESKESFEIHYDTVYAVRILSDSFLYNLIRKRDGVNATIQQGPDYLPTKADQEKARALINELNDLDRQVKAEFKPDKAVASCKAGPTTRPPDSGSPAEKQVVHLYANITRDPNGKLQLSCGKR